MGEVGSSAGGGSIVECFASFLVSLCNCFGLSLQLFLLRSWIDV